MDDLEKRIDALSPEKRRLLDARRKQGGAEVRLELERPLSNQPAGTQPCAFTTPLADDLNAIRGMQFSLFFFSGDGSDAQPHKYQLLLEAAKFADENDLCAVWTPERHFDAFGGAYPNPSVIMAALAVLTKNIELRAGSVVLPLHHPVRVVEEWAVVDNLSGGRVSLSFASGWHRDDFVLAPHRYHSRKETIIGEIETVQRLWRGDAVSYPGVDDQERSVRAFPRPLRQPLPVWLTSAGNVSTFETAGRIGANVLTGLTGQSVDDLARKLQIYRETLIANGHDPHQKKVALMLHTYLGGDLLRVRELVRPYMYDYLRINLGLHEKMAQSRNLDIRSGSFTSDDQESLLEYAFARYFEGSSLLGTVETGARMVARLRRIGVTEVACLIDFGPPSEVVLKGLRELKELCRLCAP
jgi:natural product biosynthesis luciferase-like monooxygenase protein